MPTVRKRQNRPPPIPGGDSLTALIQFLTDPEAIKQYALQLEAKLKVFREAAARAGKAEDIDRLHAEAEVALAEAEKALSEATATAEQQTRETDEHCAKARADLDLETGRERADLQRREDAADVKETTLEQRETSLNERERGIKRREDNINEREEAAEKIRAEAQDLLDSMRNVVQRKKVA